VSVLRVAFSGYEDRGHDFRARALRRSRADALGARWSAGPPARGKASLSRQFHCGACPRHQGEGKIIARAARSERPVSGDATHPA